MYTVIQRYAQENCLENFSKDLNIAHYNNIGLKIRSSCLDWHLDDLRITVIFIALNYVN